MPAYMTNNSTTQQSIHELLSLPFLPHTFIEAQFNIIRASADPSLEELFDYVNINWIKNTMWTPKNWSVFDKQIRTNNDCEGLHHLWNTNFGNNNSFYLLVANIYKICTQVPTTMSLVANNKLDRKVSTKDRKRSKKLNKVWEQMKKATDPLDPRIAYLSANRSRRKFKK